MPAAVTNLLLNPPSASTDRQSSAASNSSDSSNDFDDQLKTAQQAAQQSSPAASNSQSAGSAAAASKTTTAKPAKATATNGKTPARSAKRSAAEQTENHDDEQSGVSGDAGSDAEHSPNEEDPAESSKPSGKLSLSDPHAKSQRPTDMSFDGSTAVTTAATVKPTDPVAKPATSTTTKQPATGQVQAGAAQPSSKSNTSTDAANGQISTIS